MLLGKPCSLISKVVRVFRVMGLLENKREDVAIAVSDEWQLKIHTKRTNHPYYSKVNIYDP